jgi:RimJ/RimL family protein N-acetyltransferase
MRIKTDKFTLREWNSSDYESLAENANNINVWNRVRDFFPHPYTIDDAKAYIDMIMQSPRPENFAIEVEGKAVGGIGIVPGSDVERLSAEIGYWLGEKYWGKGIMTEVVKIISQYVFNNTDFIRLFAPVFAFNEGSAKVLEKAGYTKIGVLHKAAIKNGKIIDMYYYELVKS